MVRASVGAGKQGRVYMAVYERLVVRSGGCRRGVSKPRIANTRAGAKVPRSTASAPPRQRQCGQGFAARFRRRIYRRKTAALLPCPNAAWGRPLRAGVRPLRGGADGRLGESVTPRRKSVTSRRKTAAPHGAFYRRKSAALGIRFAAQKSPQKCRAARWVLNAAKLPRSAAKLPRSERTENRRAARGI